jgi:hypothetical protein
VQSGKLATHLRSIPSRRMHRTLLDFPISLPDVVLKCKGIFKSVALRRYSRGLRAGRTGFDSVREKESFLYFTVSIAAMEPTNLPIQWIPGVISSVVKRPGREADHSYPSNAEDKNSKAIPPLPMRLLGLVPN